MLAVGRGNSKPTSNAARGTRATRPRPAGWQLVEVFIFCSPFAVRLSGSRCALMAARAKLNLVASLKITLLLCSRRDSPPATGALQSNLNKIFKRLSMRERPRPGQLDRMSRRAGLACATATWRRSGRVGPAACVPPPGRRPRAPVGVPATTSRRRLGRPSAMPATASEWSGLECRRRSAPKSASRVSGAAPDDGAGGPQREHRHPREPPTVSRPVWIQLLQRARRLREAASEHASAR
jgi:hypothetical protein